MSNYPYAPSLELYREWQREANHNEPIFLQVAAMAAQWGADRELEACCEWLDNEIGASDPNDLRAARRPKPPSLKQQALKALASAPGSDYPSVVTVLNADEHALIRRALEQLPENK